MSHAEPTSATIRVRGARVHNLVDVDVDIPKNSLVVFTGPSGSGKSSLAFDTIFAEGQRRYVESFSAYARMFLDQVARPDVDSIEGLSPAVAIDQRSTSKNPRSTVGTLTEIMDYLRLIWSRAGTPHCVVCDAPIGKATVHDMADDLMRLPEGTRFQLLAPTAHRAGTSAVDLVKQLSADGYSRVELGGTVHRVADLPEELLATAGPISVVVDRLVAGADVLDRLTDSLETTLALGHGEVVIDLVGDDSPTGRRSLTERVTCPNGHPSAITDFSPKTFSFNAPFGACPVCSGLGVRTTVDPELALGDASMSIRDGVVLPWANATKRGQVYFLNLLKALAKEVGFSIDTPWRDLEQAERDAVLYGTDESVQVSFTTRFNRKVAYNINFEGVVSWVERKFSEAETDRQRARHGAYLREIPCAACDGHRLRPEVLAVKVDGHSIAHVTELNLRDALAFIENLTLTPQQRSIADRAVEEVRSRLTFLLEVGLPYLSLGRGAATLSGGEAQRIRLATQIGAGLTGVLYVLDEPSIGLHQRDNDRLITTLHRLRDQGNTVLVVEHDEDTMRAADWIVDVGPGAGILGGRIIHNGPLDELLRNESSTTGAYLTGRQSIGIPSRRAPDPQRMIRVTGAAANNLRDVTAEFPLGILTAVTGVSGSGKSTLVNDILYRALAQRLNGAEAAPSRHSSLTGLADLDKIVHVDQSPIGRTPRSNPATYTGVFDRIRNLFADTPEAKARGYTAGRFSFNVKGGRCEACQGDGSQKIEMNFLPDVFVTCAVCRGARYNRETLEVRFKGKSIADVLDLGISEATEFFSAFTIIARYLQALVDVGLGYVKLGQSGTTLSGGEAQRVKLATELQRRTKGRNIYVLDEPTTGLHFDDVKRLIEVLDNLVEQGNTVIVIEHNLDLIKTADWVIDMGPEGGAGGGTVLATGTPEQVAAHPDSVTGRYLARVLTPELAATA